MWLLHGKPKCNPKNCIYNGGLPCGKDGYTAMTMAMFCGRDKLHFSQCIATSKMTMDRVHGRMLKKGYYRYLSTPVQDLDDGNPTRIH